MSFSQGFFGGGAVDGFAGIATSWQFLAQRQAFF
jgi:hypothetical protein